VRCSVCVATFRRPEGLRLLLDSLADQIVPPDLRIEVVVVDNDGTAPVAPEICATFRDQHPELDVIVDVEPERNIARARNRTVDLAKGEAMAFIDDDEVADPHWIARLVETMDRYDADGVFGRVTARFPAGAPTWIADLDMFNRPSPPTGSAARYTRTSNCLIRTAKLTAHRRGDDGPFDPAYGRTGGSDSDLFERMRRAGATLVTAHEAEVTELVPEERTRPQWMLRRAFRQGALYAYRSTRQVGLGSKAVRAVGSAGRAVIGALITLVSVSSPSRRAQWALRTTSYCGHLAGVAGVVPQGY
jgi:succinoglycan biosynthesis protein ExoM